MSESPRNTLTIGNDIRRGWDTARRTKAVFTKNCPSWLEPKADGSGFKLVVKHVKTVQRMFELAFKEGKGSHLIAKTLHDEGRATLGNADVWESPHVLSVLKNEAVIGHYQQRGTSKRPGTFRRENYFPPIIDPDVFRTVQGQITKRQKSGGKKGENVTNLFSGLLYCGACGEKVRTVNGNGKHTYLRCKKAFYKTGCDAQPHPYNEIESKLLIWIAGYGQSLARLGTVEADTTAALQAEIEDKKVRKQNLEDLIEASGEGTFNGGFAGAAKRIRDLEREIAELEQQVIEVRKTPPLDATLDMIWNAFDAHAKAKARRDSGLSKVRMQMQSMLRSLLDRVVLTDEFVVRPARQSAALIDRDDPAKGYKHIEAITFGMLHLYGPLIERIIAYGDPIYNLKPVERQLTPDGQGMLWKYVLDPASKRTVKPRNTQKRRGPSTAK